MLLWALPLEKYLLGYLLPSPYKNHFKRTLQFETSSMDPEITLKLQLRIIISDSKR